MLDTIPQFPELADLGREHKPAVDAALSRMHVRTSELTFTNLYIWRHAYGARVTRIGDVVCVLSLRADPEESFALPPLGAEAAAEHVHACLDLLAQEGHDAKLCRVDEPTMRRLSIDSGEFSVESDRDNWDYVYHVPDLIDLPDQRYQDKRKHIERFTRRFSAEYRRITPDLVPACRDLQDLWCDEKHCDLHSSLRAESRAVKEVLESIDDLGVIGGAIVVRDRVQAFTLGEPLSDDTVVIHIEKASPDLHGAFQVINQRFLKEEWPQWRYVNREQDVGDPGLRRAKESYHPSHMVEKYVVRRHKG